MRSYSELIHIPNFEDRLEYLKLLDNNVHSPRHMSRDFYKTHLWEVTRKLIIGRDLGFDLGVFGVYIPSTTIVHHINPITEYDILNFTRKVTDPENLITTSLETHNKIHYRVKEKEEWIERTPNDTILW